MMITLALTGDVMLGRGVNETLPDVRPEEPWGDVLPLLDSADLRIINLECAITAHKQPWSRTPKVFHFRADPLAASRVLEAARIDACSLANNHTLDFEERGLLDTLAHLETAGCHYAGGGRDVGQAARPALLGGGLALLAFTDIEAPYDARRGQPAANFLPVSVVSEVLR